MDPGAWQDGHCIRASRLGGTEGHRVPLQCVCDPKMEEADVQALSTATCLLYIKLSLIPRLTTSAPWTLIVALAPFGLKQRMSAAQTCSSASLSRTRAAATAVSF